MITIGLDEVVTLEDVAPMLDEQAVRQHPKRESMTPLKWKMAVGVFATSLTFAVPLVADATQLGPPGQAFNQARDATTAPHVTADGDVGAEFNRLVEQWQAETMFSSSLTEQYGHPAYQRIIALGDAVVPFLLDEMNARPDHWGYALTKITGQDPVPKEAHGRLREVAAAWLAWGKDRGLLA